MQVHWMKQETIDKLFKNSANCMSDRTGKGVYVHNIGACSIFSKEHQLVEENHGNHVDYLDVMKQAYTNKKTGEIQNIVIKDVVDLVETQKEAYLASQQPISDDESSAASANLTRIQVNQMVEEAVTKKKDRLVGLARRASSCPSSSQAPYVDPTIIAAAEQG
uniref:Uncharacterized protein n=1 Tax=Brassica oleracea TaxID=3712 RepID=A0A3P6F185_BRAOL|nr:unnamed protein product [Brassica oleracea]